jgi:flagellar biosynthesis protein FlhB
MTLAARRTKEMAMKIGAQTMEDIMFGVRQTCKMVALSFAGVLIVFGAPDASAQKKMSYEQAYKICKQQVDRTYPSALETTGRQLHGGACMKQYGFNLKKSAKF